MSIFSGSCGSLTCLASDRHDFNDLKVEWAATAGTSYYILLTEVGDNGSTLDLSIQVSQSRAPSREAAAVSGAYDLPEFSLVPLSNAHEISNAVVYGSRSQLKTPFVTEPPMF